MSWVYLVIAALFEMGWPFGMKMASVTGAKVIWLIFAIVAMGPERIFFVSCPKANPDRNSVCGMDGNWNARNIFRRNNIVSRRC